MASRSTRIFTGFAGLPVIKEPHMELLRFYKKILRNLEKLPAESKYRTSTQQLIEGRKKIIESNPNPDDIEKKIGAGLCEELIEQAKHELDLIETMKEFKPWEPLEDKPPQNQWKWPL